MHAAHELFLLEREIVERFVDHLLLVMALHFDVAAGDRVETSHAAALRGAVVREDSLLYVLLSSGSR